MTRASLSKKLRTLAILSALVAAAAASSGCMIEVTDDGLPVSGLADLEVRWTIDSVDSANLCSVYGVRSWLIELRGPESRDVVLDCKDNYWTTENDLLMLEEGFYDVRVVALDRNGYELARRSTSIDLFDRGYVEVVRLDFRNGQF
jgi:hypothetical protein